MTVPKPIWAGKYAGIAAEVRLRGNLPVPYLAGQMAIHPDDARGIMDAAVVGLAAERDTKETECQEIWNELEEVRKSQIDNYLGWQNCIKERDALRERIAKLEAALGALLEDANRVHVAWDKTSDTDLAFDMAALFLEIERARNALKGPANGETK